MIAMPVGKGWPHVVIRREPHNERFEVKVGNVVRPELIRPAAFAFFHAGAVDRDGRLTPAGRELVTEGVRKQVRPLRSETCIVWGPRECTWLGVRDIEGNDPLLISTES